MRLVEIGMLKSRAHGNKKLFSLRPDFIFAEEIRSIVFKTEGVGEEILKSQTRLGAIHYAALTESMVSGIKESHQDIDLVIVGDLNLEVLSNIVAREEKRSGREINYTVLKLSEFNMRKKRQDVFIRKLLTSTRVMLVGDREEYKG